MSQTGQATSREQIHHAQIHERSYIAIFPLLLPHCKQKILATTPSALALRSEVSLIVIAASQAENWEENSN